MTFTGIDGNCSLRFTDWRNSEAALCKSGESYHCMLSDIGTNGEICAPRIWIKPNSCPEYNTKLQQIDIKLCNSRYGNCPSTAYLSYTVYQYPACFYNYITTTDFTATSGLTTNTGSTTTYTGSTMSAESGTGLPAWAVAISILVPLFIFTLVTILVAICRCRIQQRKNPYDGGESLDSPRFDSEIQLHEEDETFYSNIEMVAKGRKKLTQYGVVILIGVMGAGKTKCGLELLSVIGKNKAGERNYKSLILRNFDDFESVAASDTNYCILLDDCLGRWSYSSVGQSIQDDVNRLENVFNNYIQSKKLYVVLTMNKHTWKRCTNVFKGCNFFRTEHLVPVSTLSKETKIEVLKRHLCLTDRKAFQGRKDTVRENEHGHEPFSNDDSKSPLLGETANEFLGTLKDDVDKSQGSIDQNTDRRSGKRVNNADEEIDMERSWTSQKESQRTGQVPLNIDGKQSRGGKTNRLDHDNAEGKDGDNDEVNEQPKDSACEPTKESDKYSEKETRHIKKNVMNRIANVSSQRASYLGFPETCALFARDVKILEMGERFFKDPIRCLLKRFSAWCDSNVETEREKYVAMVYMLMNGGHMDIRSIDGKLLNIAKSLCRVGDDIGEKDVQEKMAALARSYCVEKSPGCFVFQHEVIEYTLLVVAVSRHPRQIFENCDLNALKRFMITKRNWKPEGELKVQVPSDFFELLTHRFVESQVNLVNHRCMEDERFAREYKKVPGTAV